MSHNTLIVPHDMIASIIEIVEKCLPMITLALNPALIIPFIVCKALGCST